MYDEWKINGISIPHVRSASINTQEGIITLECSSINTNITSESGDVRDEIQLFQELTSQYIHNTPLLNGGSCLQIGNGEYITATDGVDTWDKCALGRVMIMEDNMSHKRLDYTLTIHYEMPSKYGSYIYDGKNGYPDKYLNITAYRSSDKSGSPCTVCKDLGWLQITEPQNVKSVELYGTAFRSYSDSLAWIELVEESKKQFWSYNVAGDLPMGFEVIRWDLETPSKVLTFQTSNHVSPFENTSGLGSWIQRIKVIYE